MNEQATARRTRWPWIAALCVLAVAHLHLVFSAAERQSVTFDEYAHVPAGASYWTTPSFDVYAHNPPLIKLLTGGVVVLANAQVPQVEEILAAEERDGRSRSDARATVHWQLGEQFMRANWQRYPDLMLAARVPVMVLSAIGLTLVARWAWRLYGPRAALLAGGLYAVSPNVCAHAGLATVDLGSTVTILAAAYAYWKHLRTRRWAHLILAGVLTGAALLSKFTALLLLGIFLLAALVEVVQRRGHRALRIIGAWALLVLIALVVVNAGYRFRGFGRGLTSFEFQSRTCKSLQAALGDVPVPLPSPYIEGFDWQKVPAEHPHVTYCAGKVIPSTTWYYYPLATWLKTPLAFLPLIALRLYTSISARRRLRHWIRHDGFLLLMPTAFAAGFLIATDVAGARYLLPCFPFLFIWLGGLMLDRRVVAVTHDGPDLGAKSPAPAAPRWPALAGLALAAMFAIEAQSVYPRYLTFFNFAAGGPERGYHWLSDADLDWGQGLIDLRDSMRERGIAHIQLAYFGTADPGVYGISYTPLLDGVDSEWVGISSYYWVGLEHNLRTPFGVLPFSVGGELYAPFRTRTPEALVGHTIFLYHIAAGSPEVSRP